MFQAFMDESDSGSAVSGWFVMAGFISTADKWAKFSAEWQKHLDYRSEHYRKIEYFHLTEMKSERDRERVKWFYKVIEEYAEIGVFAFIDLDAMHEVVDSFDWPERHPSLTNPYLIAFHSMMSGIPRSQHLVGIDSPIDFYFDETSNKAKCIEGWDLLKELAAPEVLALMGATPAFRKDTTHLPLQAADLIAGMARPWMEQMAITRAPSTSTWPVDRAMPVLSIVFDRERLRRRYQAAHDEMVRLAATSRASPSQPSS